VILRKNFDPLSIFLGFGGNIMPDFIPRPDGAFNAWQHTLVNYALPYATAWGIPDNVKTAITNESADWEGTYIETLNPINRTKVLVFDKNQLRKAYETHLRTFIKQYLAYNPKVSDEQRVAMGKRAASPQRELPSREWRTRSRWSLEASCELSLPMQASQNVVY
jgi:hypothetical protein